MKQEFSGELVLLEEALKEERHHLQGEIKRLREDLQQKHQAELSVLKAKLEKEMAKEITDLKYTLQEEKYKLKSLENDESKKCSLIFDHQILGFRHLILENLFVFCKMNTCSF